MLLCSEKYGKEQKLYQYEEIFGLAQLFYFTGNCFPVK